MKMKTKSSPKANSKWCQKGYGFDFASTQDLTGLYRLASAHPLGDLKDMMVVGD